MDHLELEVNKARRLFLYLAQKMAGDRGLQIAAAILSNGFLSDEQLSEITGMPITSVRTHREFLKNYGLLYEVRERDRGGWTISYWGTDPLVVYRVFKNRLKHVIKNIRGYIEYSFNEAFYYCPECKVKFSRDVAEVNKYRCQVCGAELIKEEPVSELTKLVDELIEKYRKLSIVR